MAGDEEKKAAAMAELSQWFTTADANGDGRLDRDEYFAFCDLANAKTAELGHFTGSQEMRNETQAGFYQASNSIDPSNDGISMAEMMMVMGVAMKKSMELRAAWEAEQAQWAFSEKI